METPKDVDVMGLKNKAKGAEAIGYRIHKGCTLLTVGSEYHTSPQEG